MGNCKTNTNCGCGASLNTLEISRRESKRFAVDYRDYLQAGEKIIGITSITLEPADGPAVSEETYSNDGKFLFFRLDATGAGVIARSYTIAIITTTQKDGINDTIESRCLLKVCS